MTSAWRNKRFSFSWLRKQAYDYASFTAVIPWLRAIGVLPEGEQPFSEGQAPVAVYDREQRPEALTALYVAKTAAEWDSWGPSSPVDFIKALAYEMNGTDERAGYSAVVEQLRLALTVEEAELAA